MTVWWYGSVVEGWCGSRLVREYASMEVYGGRVVTGF